MNEIKLIAKVVALKKEGRIWHVKYGPDRTMGANQVFINELQVRIADWLYIKMQEKEHGNPVDRIYTLTGKLQGIYRNGRYSTEVVIEKVGLVKCLSIFHEPPPPSKDDAWLL